MTKPYRPSSGTEGASFFEAWCCRCARDKAMREGCDIDECDDNEKCQIIADTMCYGIDDPKYPKEWIEDESGQRCTAFIESWEGVPEVDTQTVDMFNTTKGDSNARQETQAD